MKTTETKDFLIVDTEESNNYFVRFWVFMKNSTKVFRFSLDDLLESSGNSFIDSFSKKVLESCASGGLVSFNYHL